MPEVLAGRYILTERLGAGGMGEVWRATDEVLGRTVAVKLVLPALLDDAEFLRRFLAEARAMASVRHPAVVAIHDFGEANGRAYLVMEYVASEPLSRVLGRAGRLGVATTLELVAQAAEALQAVHDQGIVHRDVKPANLLLRPDGTLVLTDFGIAATSGRTALTGPGAVLGTPSYLAPEQVLGAPATPRTDVYALGLVAYECLAGRRAFVGENPYAVAMQRVQQAPPPLGSDVPASVAAVVQRALAIDPAHRWPSAAEFAAAVRDVAAGRAPADATTVQWGDLDTVRSSPARSRRRMPVLALAVGLVLALGAGGFVTWRLTQPGGAGASSGPPEPIPPVARDGRIPAGYAVCGEALCPTEPMCWRGLVVISGEGRPPAKEDCAQPHYWETFVAVSLPADAVTDTDLTTLIERADIVEVCSAGAMAARTRAGASTEGWNIEAWPIPADAYTVLVHCLAGSPEGETPTTVFQPA